MWWDGMAGADSDSWEGMTGRGEEGAGVGKKTGTRASPGLEDDLETVGEVGNDESEQGEQ